MNPLLHRDHGNWQTCSGRTFPRPVPHVTTLRVCPLTSLHTHPHNPSLEDCPRSRHWAHHCVGGHPSLPAAVSSWTTTLLALHCRRSVATTLRGTTTTRRVAVVIAGVPTRCLRFNSSARTRTRRTEQLRCVRRSRSRSALSRNRTFGTAPQHRMWTRLAR
jgi:hypothetical protein